MKFRSIVLSLFVLAALGLAGCTEKPQTLAKKAHTQPWDTPTSAYSVPGFKPGDEVAWEAQLRKRAQGQNEYSRAVSAP